jgi:hypothetical protein
MVSVDRFRFRASEYIAEAAATVDAEQKAALIALAQRWSRLASELDSIDRVTGARQASNIVKAA